MTPGLIARLKLTLLLLVTIAGLPALAASTDPNCTIGTIFRAFPGVQMSQNVNYLASRCSNCEIEANTCIAAARSWCMSKTDRCSSDTLGCKELLGLTCGATELTILETDPTEYAPECPDHMQNRGDGKCYCNQHDSDGIPLSGTAASEFMTSGQCTARYKAPVAGLPGPRVPPPPTTPGATAPVVDTRKCGDDKKAAQECCNDPRTCVNIPKQQSQAPGPNESIQVFCRRMQSAGMSNGGSNGNAAEVCQMRINSCNNSCGGAKDACNSLSSQVQMLGQQGLNSFANSDWGRYCAQQSAAATTPQSTVPGGGPPGGSPPGGGDGGAAGPTMAEQAAQKALDAINNAPQGKAEFKEVATDKGTNGFNVGETPLNQGTQYNGGKFGTGEGNSGSPLDKMKGGGQQGTVANNSGGQIPGGGGNGPGAKLGGKGTGSPGSPGYTTDVLQGFQNGGGGAGGGSTNTNGHAGGGFSGYGGQRDPASERGGLDLKKYLPGGRLDPGSKLGGFKPFSLEINGRHVNMWNKISERFQEKCRLGELIDCR